MSNFHKVYEFHKAFGAAINDEWTFEHLLLRQKLIQEEALEVWVEFDDVLNDPEVKFPVSTLDKKKLTKELCDLLYVIYGTGITLGIDLNRAFDQVHRSNMSKLGDDGKPIVREDGKILKGPNYWVPDMEGVF